MTVPVGLSVPYTERRNEKTTQFDTLEVADSIAVLREVDREIFDGFDGRSGLNEVAQQIAELSERIAEQVRRGNVRRICLSGSGTSGRLCFLVSVLCQHVFGKNFVDYNINGGLGAFVRSKAGIEDAYFKGVDEIEQLSDEERKATLISVSCGLSAPYISGQLLAGLERISGQVVAVGFNAPGMARREVRGERYVSFYDMLQTCSRSPDFALLTPVVGPEAIAGSVRLKAGTGTLIALFALCASVLRQVEGHHFSAVRHVQDIIANAAEYVDMLYAQNSDILQEAIGESAEAIRRRSSVHFLSNSVYGLILIADCAECPPTFGARYDDFIGYCPPEAFELGRDARIEKMAGPPIPCSGDYKTNYSVARRRDDLFLNFGGSRGLWHDVNLPALSVEMQARDKARRYSIAMSQSTGSEIPSYAPFYRFLQFKCFMNALSTIAFSSTGKVYENVMVDLRISNTKLFDRSVGIVSEFCDISIDLARTALLQSIYRCRDVAAVQEHPILAHVEAAASAERVIPLAIVLAKNAELPIEKALAMVQSGQAIRKLELADAN